ncbi:MAG: hypothetical protein DRN96_05905 [Thermoproteota archaeon]|nr:MAG: hypothetical protein DRN96_05905 [Candidatus Korarchaeota archaeon]
MRKLVNLVLAQLKHGEELALSFSLGHGAGARIKSTHSDSRASVAATQPGVAACPLTLHS